MQKNNKKEKLDIFAMNQQELWEKYLDQRKCLLELQLGSLRERNPNYSASKKKIRRNIARLLMMIEADKDNIDKKNKSRELGEK